MKIIMSQIGAFLLIGSNVFAADTLADAFKNGTSSGVLKAVYASSDYKDKAVAQNDKSAIGSGVRLFFETAPLYGVQAKVGLFGADGLGINSKDSSKIDSVFFLNDQAASGRNAVTGAGAKGYAILGEAYLKASIDKTFIQAGRMQIDAPAASSHDIYLTPNTFEAVQVINVYIPNTVIVAAHAFRMSGPDMVQSNSFTPSAQNVKASDFVSISRASAFQGLADGDGRFDTEKDTIGASVIGAIFSGIKGLTLQGWYTRVWEIMDMPHIQANYTLKAGDTDVFVSAQYLTQKAIGGTKDALSHSTINIPLGGGNGQLGNNIDATHYEAKLGVSHKGITVTAAYSDTKGVDDGAARGSVVSPVGGNASWVRTRYQSAHVGFTDTSSYTGGTKAYSLGVAYDFAAIGLDSLKTDFKYLSFDREDKYYTKNIGPGLLLKSVAAHNKGGNGNAFVDTKAIEASLDYDKAFGVKGLTCSLSYLSVDNNDKSAAGYSYSTDHSDVRVALNFIF